MYEAAFAFVVVVRLPFFFSFLSLRRFPSHSQIGWTLVGAHHIARFFEETYQVVAVHGSLKLLYFYSLVLVHNRRNCLQL